MIKNIELPILADGEVIVCGGGVAGVAAALVAARSGAKVILIEQMGACGGMSTSGLVPVFIHMSDRKNLVASGICHEIIQEMCNRMGCQKINYIWQHINPEILKSVYDDKLAEAGVKVYLGVKVADVICDKKRIDSIVVATTNGLKKVTGKIFIDTTGDALVTAIGGGDFELGDSYGNTMSPTLCAQYSNINIQEMLAAEKNGISAIKLWKEHLDEIPLVEHHLVGVSEYAHGSGSGNLGHIYGTNAVDEEQLSNAYREGRKIAKIIHDFYVKYVPGYQKSDLVATGALMGVRESRRIIGDYKITFEDYLKRRHFADDIGCFYYSIDIHASSFDAEAQKRIGEVMDKTSYEVGENYGIPYRALIVKNLNNLLVAGRCISCEREVQSSIRVMPCCMITGVAAGIAAALSRGNCDVRLVDIKELQQKIINTGGYLPIK